MLRDPHTRPNAGNPPALINQSLVAPQVAFAVAAAVVAAISAGASLWLMPLAAPGAVVAVLVVMAAVTGLGLVGLRRAHPHGRLGAANIVTLVRAGIAALVAGALFLPDGVADQPMLAWAIVAIVTVGLALDGVDGWLARRAGLASDFGARFDMEVDAALAALLCLLVILTGKAGFWLLPLGFLRYAWVVAGLALPWLTGPLPDRRSRKVVCVMQIAVLTALVAPVLIPPWSVMLAVAATAALVWSFAVDAVWLWQRR